MQSGIVLLQVGILTLGLVLPPSTFAASHPEPSRRNADRFTRHLETYVLFALENLRTKTLEVEDGDIAVNDGDLLVSPRGFIRAPTSQIVAGTVRIPPDAQCSELFANDTISTSTGCGSPTAFNAPILADPAAACGFPDPFPACDAFQPIRVEPGQDCTGDADPGNGKCDLPPGTYGDLRVVSGGSINLTGGSYAFCSVRVARYSHLEVDASADISVAGNFDISNEGLAGPAPTSTIGADDILVFVNGSRLHFSAYSEIHGRFCAPLAKLRMTRGSTLQGSALARVIRTEQVAVGRRRAPARRGVITTTTTTVTTSTSTTTTTLSMDVSCSSCQAPPSKVGQHCESDPECDSAQGAGDGVCASVVVGTMTVGVSTNRRGVQGVFTAAGGNLVATAQACGEDHFNWYQILTADDHPPKDADGNQLAAPYVDPPPKGYGGGALQWADKRPWYWDEGGDPASGTPGFTDGLNVSDQTTVDTLKFSDFPGGAAGTNLSFKTWLASVNADGSFHSWHTCGGHPGCGFSWDWSNASGNNVASNVQELTAEPTNAEYQNLIGGFD